MHTDRTLDIMDRVTAGLGDQLRKFQRITCTAYETRELPRESKARVHRQNQKVRLDVNFTTVHEQDSNAHRPVPPTRANQSGSSSSAQPSVPEIPVGLTGRSYNSTTRRLKSLNLNTYKLHALGDYTATIRRYGTTDSYSTEPVRSMFLSR
jgi:hypothetical protein